MQTREWVVTASLCNLHRYVPQRDLRRLILSDRYCTRLDHTLVLIAHRMRTPMALRTWPAYESAARAGHVELLEWMVGMGVFRLGLEDARGILDARADPVTIVTVACQSHQLGVLLWIIGAYPHVRAYSNIVFDALARHRFYAAIAPALAHLGNRTSCSIDVMARRAVCDGNLPFILWARENGYFPSPTDSRSRHTVSSLAGQAACCDQADVFRWLAQNGYPVDPDTRTRTLIYPRIQECLDELGYD